MGGTIEAPNEGPPMRSIPMDSSLGPVGANLSRCCPLVWKRWVGIGREGNMGGARPRSDSALRAQLDAQLDAELTRAIASVHSWRYERISADANKKIVFFIIKKWFRMTNPRCLLVRACFLPSSFHTSLLPIPHLTNPQAAPNCRFISAIVPDQ